MRTHALLALFFVLALWTGCVSSTVVAGKSKAPAITIDESGAITFNDQHVQLGKLASALKSAGIEKSQVVNIQIPEHFDREVMRRISTELVVKNGYIHTFFVTKRKATATLVEPK